VTSTLDRPLILTLLAWSCAFLISWALLVLVAVPETCPVWVPENSLAEEAESSEDRSGRKERPTPSIRVRATGRKPSRLDGALQVKSCPSPVAFALLAQAPAPPLPLSTTTPCIAAPVPLRC
jgi:hypothetical protein